jgi:peptidoglycan/xylan/chitin deacetylase (PgdA/CDA1 family)
MLSFLIKSPWWLRALYPSLLWRMPASASGKQVYLTFDDGPTEFITSEVLRELKQHNALATFFLIGKNAQANPQLVKDITAAGHAIGNHTHNHLKGWNTALGTYLANVDQAVTYTSNTLFRPPYGRIKRSQLNALKTQYRIVMWDVLSGDFDQNLSATDCTRNVLKFVEDGSIIVFHDSVKAWPRLRECLPAVLEALVKQGYGFGRIEPAV